MAARLRQCGPASDAYSIIVTGALSDPIACSARGLACINSARGMCCVASVAPSGDWLIAGPWVASRPAVRAPDWKLLGLLISADATQIDVANTAAIAASRQGFRTDIVKPQLTIAFASDMQTTRQIVLRPQFMYRREN